MFSMEDILGEFEDAARLGRIDVVHDAELAYDRRSARHYARSAAYRADYYRRPEVRQRRSVYATEYGRRYHVILVRRAYKRRRIETARSMRVSYVFSPSPPVVGTCDKCGAPTELREGASRPIHSQPCRRKAA